MHEIPEISPDELKQLQTSEFFLLDVREPHEFCARNLNGHLIPLAELPDRLNEIPKDKPIVVHCRSGMRSAQAVEFLLSNGFTDVVNLKGGILACD